VPLPSVAIAPDTFDAYTPKEHLLSPGPLDLELSWEAYPDARSYELIMSATPDFTGSLSKVPVSATSTLLKGQVFGGKRFYYKLLARLDHGEHASSLTGDVDFRFRAPVLASPADNALVESGSAVLFTWSRTRGIRWYFLELARDPEFNRVIEKNFVKTNF